MIVEALYKNVLALDRVQHKSLRMRHGFTDLTPTAGMNAVFVAAIEFADVCREYPIVFVRAGKDEATGKDHIAPMAVLGISQNDNLYLQPGGRWRTSYMPAFLRRYPFGMASVGPDQMAICIDRAWDGWSETEGDPLFEASGEPTQLLKNVQNFVENFEQEVHRTRLFCGVLRDEGLLQDMRFDATLPDGQKMAVDGFLAIDEKKLAELPDAKVVELHRNGILGLIHAQQVSMGLMRRLVEWHAERAAAKH
ncbi:SapC family protein [Ideonella sp. BN130291]|uniref:SapC family protein n=1 Tax=Ideonella sp. BN130291 TaxID=3112940 RepID=UPI002E26CEE4|nr:SapC family protein [Ideonella sp. BN130291]